MAIMAWMSALFSPRLQVPSEKDLLAEQHALALHYFLHDDGEQRDCKLPSPATMPGRLFARETAHYKKSVYYFPAHTKTVTRPFHLDIVTENDEYYSQVWHVAPVVAVDAIAWGAYRPQALTSRMIYQLGRYRHKTATRAIGFDSDQGIISNRYLVKMALVELTQSRLQALQPLERLCNAYDAHLSAQENRQHILDSLTTYEEAVSSLLERLPQTFKTAGLPDYDRDAIADWTAYLEKDLQDSRQYKKMVAGLSETKLEEKLQEQWLNPSHSACIYHFVRSRSRRALTHLQVENESITYSNKQFALLQGDLNSALEDARYELNSHTADPVKPVLASHQGQHQPGANGLVALVSKSFCDSNQTHRQFLTALCFASGLDQIKAKDTHHCELQAYDIFTGQTQHSPLRTTSATKWLTQGVSFGVKLRRVIAWPFKLCLLILGTLLETAGALLPIPNRWLEKLTFRRWLQYPIKAFVNSDCQTQSASSSIASHLQQKPLQLGVKIRQLVSQYIGNTLWELAKGLVTLPQRFSFEMFTSFRNDWYDGHIARQQTEQALDQATMARLHRQLAAYQQQYRQHAQALARGLQENHPDHNLTPSDKPKQLSGACMQAYRLDDNRYHDLLNASVRGLRTFSELYTHDLMTKHPTVGLVFMASYGLGLMAVTAPELTRAIVGNGYTKFLLFLSKLSAKEGTLSAAVGSALFHSQIIAGTMEFGMHGPDSWLIKTVKGIAHDPTKIALLLATAAGIGRLIANMHIPGISDPIKHEAEDAIFPDSVYAFAGAKITIALYELLESHPQNDMVATTIINDAIIKKLQENQARNAEHQAQNSQLFELLYVLFTSQQAVAHLDSDTKHQVLCMLERHLDDAAVSAYKQMLYPEQQESIARETLNILTAYLVLVLRCLASLVTWSARPWRDLGRQLAQDSTRVATAVFTLATVICTGLWICFKLPIRVLRKGLSFLWGKCCGDHNRFAKQSQAACLKVETASSVTQRTLQSPIEKMQRAVTAKHPYVEAVQGKHLPLYDAQRSQGQHEPQRKPQASSSDHARSPVLVT